MATIHKGQTLWFQDLMPWVSSLSLHSKEEIIVIYASLSYVSMQTQYPRMFQWKSNPKQSLGKFLTFLNDFKIFQKVSCTFLKVKEIARDSFFVETYRFLLVSVCLQKGIMYSKAIPQIKNPYMTQYSFY